MSPRCPPNKRQIDDGLRCLMGEYACKCDDFHHMEITHATLTMKTTPSTERDCLQVGAYLVEGAEAELDGLDRDAHERGELLLDVPGRVVRRDVQLQQRAAVAPLALVHRLHLRQHAAAQPQHQVQRGLLLDVVVRLRASGEVSFRRRGWRNRAI